MDMNGPIPALRQISSRGTMGPLKVIGSFLHGHEWAHSRSSVVFFMGDDGPT